MILAHKIAPHPTVEQEAHFRRAAGTARFAYNWALGKWQEQHKAGEKPSANKLKAQWNAVRRTEFPWSLDVTKCAGSQAILNLGTAFTNFFEGRADYPTFKKKGQHDSFALWNDQFEMRARPFRFGKARGEVRIPNLGWVKTREPLRLDGRIMGAVVSRDAGRWFIAVQVEKADPELAHTNPGSVVGIDLGISALMTLSRPLADGTLKIENPKALRKAMRRVRKMSRRISRQEEFRKKRNAKTSRRMQKRRTALAKRHGRVASIRRDAIHKATTAIARRFEAVILEDLNVAGMVKNHNLAGAISDAAFGEIRRQFEYKTRLQGGALALADRWYPSSKRCSACGHVVLALPLSVREWTCPGCGTVHDRDGNAATNLEHLMVGPAWSEPLADKPPATRGDTGALAGPQGPTKLRWVNRELQPGALVRTK